MAPAQQWGTGKWVTFRMSGQGKLMQLTLPVNPDELQRDHPGRLTTTQTLGGAYQDVNDIGISQITLQGTTGWRGRPGANMDGLQYALHLYKYIFEEYYRRARVDPSKTELLLIDGIDGDTWRVSIDDLQLFRSKSQPLLFQYNVMMTVLQNMNDPQDPPADVVKDTTKNTTSSAQKGINKGRTHNIKTLRTYTVQASITLSGISYKFFKTFSRVQEIAQLNRIKNINLIYVGQVLKIPW